jgi:hypothetical protein
MPYKSKVQVGYMHVHHPKIAKRWDKKYGVRKGLPKHVKAKSTRRRRRSR